MKKFVSKNNRWLILAIGILLIAAILLVRSRKRSAFIEVPVKKGAIVQAVYGIGTVKANHIYALRVGVTTTITDLYVKEGGFARAGARLLSVDGSTTFRAPFTGTVTSLPVKIGETVFPQNPLLILTDLRDLYLVVSLEQQAAILVKPGQKSSISFENMREQTYHGVVRTIYSNAGQFLVDIQTPDLPSAILPDMTADVGIQIDIHENALMAPVAAVSEKKLLLKRNGQVMKTDINVGLIDGENVEITLGDVEEGDIALVPRR